ncbi:MAG: phosphopantothenate--cysteine ligase [Lactobacillales bacterium]|jgi:phosphopantothenate-cysteine ligase|nr:phosphopantothenate--cysteine ligase [Lactobacillales bacterium]
MKILVTAGGTTEPIDDVRGITNHSSGRLGSFIAQDFFLEGHEVDYITTRTAVSVKEKHRLQLHYIQSTSELKAKMNQLLTENTYDAVIHSMAVSDYTPTNTTSGSAFVAQLAKEIENAKTADLKETLTHALDAFSQTKQENKKISSDEEKLIVVLQKTPKVIQMIKEMQPQTILVGFKLLVDVSNEQLVHVALESMKKNHADFILANDLHSISGDKHTGLLVRPDGDYKVASTKQQIAKLIVQSVEEKVKAKR